MTEAVREQAPAKVNLVLQVGARQANGLHEVCSLFASLELHDTVTVEEAAERDEVICPGVAGPNLAAVAIEAFRREAGADLPPLRVAIEKRIPVAAGLAGGSADAAAVLRAANELAGRPLEDDALREIAAPLGSDVPSQVRPAHALVTGTGEVVEPLALPAMWLMLAPSTGGLSTADVFAEADRLQSTRERLDPDSLRALVAQPPEAIAAAMANDLQPAALSLRPVLEMTLAALREAGAHGALVAGSGPTAFGVFPSREAAGEAAAHLGRHVIVTGLREPRA